MTLFSVGRLCMKIAGRDAGRQCVVVDTINDNTVLVDGETRRRKVNVAHLEPSDQVLEVKKGASHDDVSQAFKKIGLEVRNTKPKKASAKPKKLRKVKQKAPAAKPAKKATPKKEVKKEEPKAEVKKETKKEVKPSATPAQK